MSTPRIARIALKFVMLPALVVAPLLSCQSTPERPAPNLVAVERTMTVTAYCPCQQCCGWKRNWYGRAVYASGPNKGKKKQVGVTASGEKAHYGTVAADPSIPFGTPLYIPGYGRGVVQDRGGAIKGDHIDVFFKSHKQALEWGRKTLPVQIWLPPSHTLVARR